MYSVCIQVSTGDVYEANNSKYSAIYRKGWGCCNLEGYAYLNEMAQQFLMFYFIQMLHAIC